MASYKFDSQLVVPNVISDQVFQATGIYVGEDAGIHYAVIDPRRHNIDVWQKPRVGTFHTTATPPGSPVLLYQMTAQALGSHYFTNGPMMNAGSLPSTGLGWLNWIIAQLWTTLSLFTGARWIPVGPIISGGSVIHRGLTSGGTFFGRNGSGAFSNYFIGVQLPNAIEAIGGLVRIIPSAGGGVISTPTVLGVTGSVGICGWGLRPISPGIVDGWTSEVPYIVPENDDVLDGVIIVAGSDHSTAIPNVPVAMLGVGVTAAVVLDGSDSVIMGAGGTLFIPCAPEKDRIQRYGFCCR